MVVSLSTQFALTKRTFFVHFKLALQGFGEQGIGLPTSVIKKYLFSFKENIILSPAVTPPSYLYFTPRKLHLPSLLYKPMLTFLVINMPEKQIGCFKKYNLYIKTF